MLTRLRQWFTDRLAPSVVRRELQELQQNYEARGDELRKMKTKTARLEMLLGHLAVVSTDVAACKSTCPLCRGLLKQPLALSLEELKRQA